MQLVNPDFKTVVEDLRSKVANVTDPNMVLGTARADAKLLGQQYQEVKIRDFTISCDEPVSSGGTDRGPTPLDFFVASVGFCENVMFTRNAALHGVEFDALETSVGGHWDRRGLYEIGGIDPSFKNMTVETRVTSKAPTEKIVEVVRATHRTCPMRVTIGKAMKVTDKLFVNGEEIPI